MSLDPYVASGPLGAAAKNFSGGCLALGPERGWSDAERQALAEAGFTGIDLTPHDEAIGGLDLEGTVAMSFRVGPLGAILRERPDLAPLLRERVREAVSPWLRGDAVYMPSATWLVSAQNPG